MDFIRSYFVNFVLYALILNQIYHPLITAYDEEVIPCIPKRAILNLLRLSDVSSTLAAYSRTARIIPNVKTRNDIAHSRNSIQNSDNSQICLPVEIYLELLQNSVMHRYFTVIEKIQGAPSLLRRLLDKRSIATLAKNDDLPINIHDRLNENQDDEEKRTVISSSDRFGQKPPGMLDDYSMSSELLNKKVLTQQLPTEKRNVGSLARDFALPPGRRNIASLVREYEMQTRPNAESRDLPYTDRISDLPLRGQTKKNAAFTPNSAWPVFLNRRSTVPVNVTLRPLFRQGKLLTAEQNAINYLLNLHEVINLENIRRKPQESNFLKDKKQSLFENENGLNTRINLNNRRTKSHIDLFNKYNKDLDYAEMVETLAGQSLNAEKRFMGRIPQMGPRPTTPSTRRQGR